MPRSCARASACADRPIAPTSVWYGARLMGMRKGTFRMACAREVRGLGGPGG